MGRPAPCRGRDLPGNDNPPATVSHSAYLRIRHGLGEDLEPRHNGGEGRQPSRRQAQEHAQQRGQVFQLPHVLSVHVLAMLTVIRDHSQELMAFQWQVIPSRKLVARCRKQSYAKSSAGPCLSRLS